MQLFLDKLQLVAHEPLTYIAFLFLVGAWLLRAYFLRTKDYLRSLNTLPKRDQLSALQLLALGYPQKVTANHLKLLERRYLLIAYIATLVGALILAGLLIHYWSLPDTKANKQLSEINDNVEGLRQQVGNLEVLLNQHQQNGNQTIESPPIELLQAKNKADRDLAAVQLQLDEYKKKYGELPQSEIGGQIEQAEQIVKRADKALTVDLTLNNDFIERYKNRVTADTNFIVDKVGGVHSASGDGDIHVAGRDNGVGLRVVAEIMNAKDQSSAIDVLRQAEGRMAPVGLSGVWRIWFERTSGAPLVQGEPLTPADTSNPEHVFEIHPVTRVDGIQVLNSVHVVDGFEPKDAQRAFTYYNNLGCKITPGLGTITLSSVPTAYNYVKFSMEVTGNAQEAEDGWFLPAKVRDLNGEQLADNCRMVFVRGTSPAASVPGLKQGAHLEVLGMPRINLAEVAERVNNSQRDPRALYSNLPYEMVIVGIFG
jgi:hypothetical protein